MVAANHRIDAPGPGLRRASVIAGLALILALFVLVQEPADAAPQSGAVASVALPGIVDGASPQIGQIAQIVCPILLSIRSTFASTPFFSFAQPVIDQLLVAFGCIGAPTTTTTVAPTTTTTVPPPTTTTTLFPVPTIPGINLGQITCPILLSLRASFANSPFSAFLPIIDQLIVAFGCVVSG